MGLMKELNRVYKAGENRYKRAVKARPKRLYTTEIIRPESLLTGAPEENLLIHGDNRNVCISLLADPEIKGKIKAIYIAPPFFSMADYDAVLDAGGEKIRHRAYKDNWSKGMAEYLKMLTVRLLLMRDLLAEDGLIFVHVDWHAAHYVRAVLDEVFGSDNFVNEIIWQYKSGGSSKKRFARKHDNIFMYAKTSKYRFFPQQEKSYNRGLKPYRFKGVEEFRDDVGWYTMVNMKDVWSIDMVGRTSSERTGYATQKPEQLVERILLSATEPGDLCADFFCGSGTLGAVCAKTGRRFLMVDSGRLAVETAEARLIKQGASFTVLRDKKPKDSGLGVRVDLEKDDAGKGISNVSVTLRDIKPVGAEKAAEDAKLEKIEQIKAEDPMELVLSWSVDFDYDGEVHRPDVLFVRENGKMETSCLRQVATDGVVSVKVTDIFGNVKFRVFDPASAGPRTE